MEISPPPHRWLQLPSSPTRNRIIDLAKTKETGKKHTKNILFQFHVQLGKLCSTEDLFLVCFIFWGQWKNGSHWKNDQKAERTVWCFCFLNEEQWCFFQRRNFGVFQALGATCFHLPHGKLASSEAFGVVWVEICSYYIYLYIYI